MKTKAFIFFSLLICNLLPAQNIKLDITPHFLGVRADSLLLSMDVSVEIPAQIDWAGQMAFLIGWGSPFDADDHTYKVFGTDKGANYSSYSNEEVDKYLTEARQSADPEVRKEAYANFQKALAEDPAYAMICYIDANYVADSNIKGINPDTIMGHHGVGIFWNVADWTIE